MTDGIASLRRRRKGPAQKFPANGRTCIRVFPREHTSVNKMNWVKGTYSGTWHTFSCQLKIAPYLLGKKPSECFLFCNFRRAIYEKLALFAAIETPLALFIFFKPGAHVIVWRRSITQTGHNARKRTCFSREFILQFQVFRTGAHLIRAPFHFFTVLQLTRVWFTNFGPLTRFTRRFI